MHAISGWQTINIIIINIIIIVVVLVIITVILCIFADQKFVLMTILCESFIPLNMSYKSGL